MRKSFTATLFVLALTVAGAQALTKSWEGHGNLNTQPITVVSQPWTITHQNRGGGILQIFVYDANTGALVDLAANTMQAGQETTHIYATGTFYLSVNAANTIWSMSIDATGTSESPIGLNTVLSDAGTGTKNSAPFQASAPWKIVHSNTGGGILQIFVYDVATGALVDLAANQTSAGQVETYIYQTGQFYVAINAANTRWTVDVLSR